MIVIMGFVGCLGFADFGNTSEPKFGGEHKHIAPTIEVTPTYLPFVTFITKYDPSDESAMDPYEDMRVDTNFTAITNTSDEDITVLLTAERYVAYPPYPTSSEYENPDIYGIFSVDVEDGDIQSRGGMDDNTQTLFTIRAGETAVRGVTFVTWMSPDNIPAMANELGILNVDVVDEVASTEGPEITPNTVLFHAEVALDGTVIVMPRDKEGADDIDTPDTSTDTTTDTETPAP